MTNPHNTPSVRQPAPGLPRPGFDPEMLFVECARCGNPVMWEAGKTTELLRNAGVDPLELDRHCLLVTDGCPRCTGGNTFHVQIFRVDPGYGTLFGGRNVGHS